MAGKARDNTQSATRRKLMDAGVRLFGLHGYEATATRALAAAAGTNLGAILYHFGGKEGLYRAVLEQCVAEKLAQIGPCMERVRTVCADPDANRARVEATLEEWITAMINTMLGDPSSRSFSQIVMQEQIAPTPAHDICYKGFLEKVHGIWGLVLSRLTGLPPESPELLLRTLSVMGMFTIFRMAMTSMLRRLEIEELTQGHLDCIIRFGIQQVKAIAAQFEPVCGEVRA